MTTKKTTRISKKPKAKTKRKKNEENKIRDEIVAAETTVEGIDKKLDKLSKQQQALVHIADRRKVDIRKAVELRLKGLTLKEIATYFDATQATVCRALQKFEGLDFASTRLYQENKSDIFANMQWRLISSVTDEDINKMAVRDRIWAAAVLYDKQRLQDGQSTANTSVQVYSSIVKAACKE